MKVRLEADTCDRQVKSPKRVRFGLWCFMLRLFAVDDLREDEFFRAGAEVVQVWESVSPAAVRRRLRSARC